MRDTPRVAARWIPGDADDVSRVEGKGAYGGLGSPAHQSHRASVPDWGEHCTYPLNHPSEPPVSSISPTPDRHNP